MDFRFADDTLSKEDRAQFWCRFPNRTGLVRVVEEMVTSCNEYLELNSGDGVYRINLAGIGNDLVFQEVLGSQNKLYLSARDLNQNPVVTSLGKHEDLGKKTPHYSPGGLVGVGDTRILCKVMRNDYNDYEVVLGERHWKSERPLCYVTDHYQLSGEQGVLFVEDGLSNLSTQRAINQRNHCIIVDDQPNWICYAPQDCDAPRPAQTMVVQSSQGVNFWWDHWIPRTSPRHAKDLLVYIEGEGLGSIYKSMAEVDAPTRIFLEGLAKKHW